MQLAIAEPTSDAVPGRNRGSSSAARASPCSRSSSTPRSCSSRSRRSAAVLDSRSSSLSWILNAYTIVFAALLIPMGRLADRVGRRRTFLTAAVGFTVASMLCGIAPTVAFLVATNPAGGRAAALVPSSLALVLQTFHVTRFRSPWPSGVRSVPSRVPPGHAWALVIENLGWRWAFYINLPVGIVSFFLGRRVLPEWREANPGRLPGASVGLLTAGWRSPRSALCRRMMGMDQSPLHRVRAGRCHTGRPVRPAKQPGSNPVLDLTLFESQSFRWLTRRCWSRRRLLGDVPRQCAVPHRRVALLDPSSRHGDLRRAADRRHNGAAVRQAGRRVDNAGC